MFKVTAMGRNAKEYVWNDVDRIDSDAISRNIHLKINDTQIVLILDALVWVKSEKVKE
jgi:hypothetical protein